jgi:hypothetical protein
VALPDAPSVSRETDPTERVKVMEASKQTLPADVLGTLVAMPSYVADMIQPAVEAVRGEARQGVREGEYRRLTRKTEEFLRRYTDPSYANGIAVVIATAFPGVAAAETRRATDRTCSCDGCDDQSCEGECDSCDDYDCDQHGCSSNYSCCSYCSDCDTHHGDGDDRVITIQSGRCHHVYCTDCQHVCDDY